MPSDADASVDTAFETETGSVDRGVEKEVTATEDYEAYGGEQITRETTLSVLDDGGVHVHQTDNQGTGGSLTLGEAVVQRLVGEVLARSTTSAGVHVVTGEVDRVQDRPANDTVFAQVEFDTSEVPDSVPVADWLEHASPEIDLRVQTEEDANS